MRSTVAAWLFLCGAMAAQGADFYVLQGIDKTQPDRVIRSPRLSGYTVRVSWDNIRKNGFQWLDEQIARGQELDRDVQLRVMAGAHAPQNLPGVSYYRYGGSKRAPVPWDAGLLTHWWSLVNGLSERYADNERIKFVHVPGFANSSELHTPDSIKKVPGYSSNKLALAVIAMATPLINGFQNATVAMNYATPNQSNMSRADSEWMLDRFAELAGDRAGFQSNDLSPQVKLSRNKYQTLIEQEEEGHQIGFQMLSDSGASRFRGTFDKAVNIGIEAGAEWFEVYARDVPDINIAAIYANSSSGIASGSALPGNVPEPTTVWLVGTSTLLLTLQRRRST